MKNVTKHLPITVILLTISLSLRGQLSVFASLGGGSNAERYKSVTTASFGKYLPVNASESGAFSEVISKIEFYSDFGIRFTGSNNWGIGVRHSLITLNFRESFQVDTVVQYIIGTSYGRDWISSIDLSVHRKISFENRVTIMPELGLGLYNFTNKKADGSGYGYSELGNVTVSNTNKINAIMMLYVPLGINLDYKFNKHLSLLVSAQFKLGLANGYSRNDVQSYIEGHNQVVSGHYYKNNFKSLSIGLNYHIWYPKSK